MYCKKVSEKWSGEVIKLIKGKNKPTNPATECHHLIKRLPRPFQQSVSKNAVEGETFASAELGCVISTHIIIYCPAWLKGTPCSHYIVSFSLSRSVQFTTNHTEVSMGNTGTRMLRTRTTCCPINNWMSQFLNLHVHATVSKWFSWHGVFLLSWCFVGSFFVVLFGWFVFFFVWLVIFGGGGGVVLLGVFFWVFLGICLVGFGFVLGFCLFVCFSKLQRKKNVKVTCYNKHQISLLDWENLQLSL